jgi:hypothetical protein
VSSGIDRQTPRPLLCKKGQKVPKVKRLLYVINDAPWCAEYLVVCVSNFDSKGEQVKSRNSIGSTFFQ